MRVCTLCSRVACLCTHMNSNLRLYDDVVNIKLWNRDVSMTILLLTLFKK